MTIGSKLFKKRTSHPATYESGPSKYSGRLLFGKEKQNDNEVFENYKSLT